MRSVKHVPHLANIKNIYKILDRKPKSNRPFQKPRRKRDYNIKMDLKEIVFNYADLIQQAQDSAKWQTHVKTVIKVRVP
jgi:ribosome-binding protein aMBF1 (putative translation factor)